jgi:GYF domain 2
MISSVYRETAGAEERFMTYQVSRNGQMYGPYTLEDLQRYVASGNVLLTDLAKSEDMPDWLPVSQILGTPLGTAVPPTPAYVPSSGYPAPSGISYENPPNLNWGLELLLGFLTCRLFVMIWNLVIAAWAKRIEPTSNALTYYIIATVLSVLQFGGSWGMVVSISQHHQPHQSALASLLGIAAFIIRLIARFSLRETLERHYNGPEPLGLRLSAVMTFFFGGIYFQYKLNEINRTKEILRYQNTPR